MGDGKQGHAGRRTKHARFDARTLRASRSGRSEGAPGRRPYSAQGYLESIVKTLVDGGLLNGTRGRGGGYRLAPDAESRSVGDILRLAEGSLAPVACLVPCAEECPRKEVCPTLPLWRRLNGLVEGFLDGLALGDLLSEEAIDDAARHAALR